MKLEAVIEDIETQGFFQSQSVPRIEHEVQIKAVEITLQTREMKLHLTAPLLGRNFISGFSANSSKFQWVIVPINQVETINTIHLANTFLETEVGIRDLVEQHLIEKSIKVYGSDLKPIAGKVCRLKSGLIELFANGDVFWVPIASISMIAVENFSDLN